MEEKMRKNVYLFISLALIVLLGACSPLSGVSAGLNSIPSGSKPEAVAPQTESTQPAMRTLKVTGTGTIYLVPDIAYVTIGVHTENKNVEEAVATNNTNTQKVKDAVLKSGVEEKDIQTQNFSIYQNQKYDASNQPTDLVYAVDNNLYVTLRDITKIGTLLGDVVRAGANSINGISFDVADKSKALSDASKLALQNGQKQAGDLATAEGVTLGNIQSTVILPVGYSGPIAQGMGGGGAALPAAVNVPISTGQIVVTSQIELVFEVK
jgi:uncharacterized protein YggE